MRFPEMKAAVEKNPVGSTIFNLTDDYICIPHDDGTMFGFILVQTEDGPGMFPYSSILSDNGYEQLAPEHAKLVDGSAIGEIRHAFAMLKRKVSDAEIMLTNRKTNILTIQQRKALRALSDAYQALSDAWTDEVGNALADKGLLPMRDLMEASSELWHYCEDGEVM